MAKYFLSIYPHRQAFIWKGLGEKNWRKSNSQLRDHQLLGVVSDNGRGLFRGCYFGELTRFAVLDVDQGSRYHDRAELVELAGKLEAIGLTVTPYQSSDSGGWHLYLFFDDWADSQEVSQTLRTWLKLIGYEIKGGQLEVFPSGCALRLPLQPGFAWLDDQGQVICRREEINESEALASFLTDLESNACSWGLAKSRIESQIRAGRSAGAGTAPEHREAIDIEGFERLWSNGRDQERIEKARYYLDNGLQAKGQRHEAIYAIEHLLWYGDPDRGIARMPGRENDQRREDFLREWLNENHNGHCRHVNSGSWRLLEGHIRRACEWRPGDHQPDFERTPYAITERSAEAMIGLSKTTRHLWRPEDLERANQKREREARAKIREAVQMLQREGKKLSIKGLALASGCDRKTVRKHSDIYRIYPPWLSKWGSDLDPGGPGGVCLLPEAASKKTLLKPPGEGETQEDSDGGSLCGWSRPPTPTLHRSASPDLALTLEECLTPYAEEELGRRRTTDGSDSGEEPPSPEASLAPGSSTGLEGLGYACGISSLAVLAPVFLGDIYISGLRSGQLRQGGEAGGVGGRDPVCYTACDIAGGIKEVSGKPSGKSVLASFRAKRGNENIIPDANNHILLTTAKSSYSSGIADEFSLIEISVADSVQLFSHLACKLSAPEKSLDHLLVIFAGSVCFFADVQAGPHGWYRGSHCIRRSIKRIRYLTSPGSRGPPELYYSMNRALAHL